MTVREKLFDVIFEDSELLVLNKPAGLVCHPTKTDEYSSLISRVRLYLGSAIRPQLINRLDRETSGLSFIAKDEHTARTLRRLWEHRQVKKEYLAIVHGHVSDPYLSIAAPLGKDLKSAVAIKDCVRDDGAEAKTELWVEATFTRQPELVSCPHIELRNGPPPLQDCKGMPFSIVRVVPHTGRKHQIRIHLAHIGHSIVGDKLYGRNEDFYLALVQNRLTAADWAELLLPYHALHAVRVRFTLHGEEKVFRAEPESWFKGFCPSSLFPA